jgi:hypothetical protein
MLPFDILVPLVLNATLGLDGILKSNQIMNLFVLKHRLS